MASKKENAKALIKYCLSTFDNAETPGFPDETSKTICTCGCESYCVCSIVH